MAKQNWGTLKIFFSRTTGHKASLGKGDSSLFKWMAMPGDIGK